MATFDYQQIFGGYAEFDTDPIANHIVKISKKSFYDYDNYGNLPNGIGLLPSSTPTATQILYGILMLLMQNQGANINADPTQKVYVADAGKTLATGARDGQVRRSFTVSFFIDAGLAGLPGVDQIDSAPQIDPAPGQP